MLVDLVEFERKPSIDLSRAEAAVRDLLQALGEDPERDGLKDTPRRVARMYAELLAGRSEDSADHLDTTFASDYDDVVVVRDIALQSLCEHHLLPFIGVAHVAYLPSNRVVGLSKLARTVRTYARRPQIQEQLTYQIADAIATHLDARGVLVRIEAKHMCMAMRGVRDHSGSMITTATRGKFRTDTARAEVLSLLNAR